MNTTGTYKAFLGPFAGISNTTGNQNAFLGANAGNANTTGTNNAFLGHAAGYSNTSGNNNTFVGNEAGRSNSTGGQNTFVGYLASFSNTGGANTFIGYQAGRNNTIGVFNTFMGVNAGFFNTSDNSNFMLGTNAGANSTSGSANFFVGDNAGGNNTTGDYNVFLGTNAGGSNTVGANNTAIGFEANVGSGNLVNATAIGFRAVASTNNSVVLGNGANVGIGTSTPSNKLEVSTGTIGQSGLRLTQLTSAVAATVLNQTKFLTVNAQGDVILGSINSSGREGATLWQQVGDNVHNDGSGAVVIGQNINKTPAGYKLYVEQGLLTEKVKVAVKSTDEWSDKVFSPAYALQPLAEVERYIRINQHLPGVPSAQQMVEQGNDLHKTDAKLLEKIEELTLYLIQMKKEISQLQQENQQLRTTLFKSK